MSYGPKPASEFIDTALVQDHLRVATDLVGQEAARMFKEGNEGALRHMPSLRFDSPLEVIFWIWWNAATDRAPGADELNLVAQREVVVGDKTYRVDFLVEPVDAKVPWKPIAIELDGHAFHERTPEQVALRDSRDRALQSAGWMVFHFSFREFTQSPVEAIAEVFVFARKQLRELGR